MLARSWTPTVLKINSLSLFSIPGLILFSMGAPFKRCADCMLNKIECDFAKIECLVSSFPLDSTMQDKFTPREPFVGCTAQAICSFLGVRQLTLHLSPPAAGYNSTHFKPLSRGAEGGSGIRIPHPNGSAWKQRTNGSGLLRVSMDNPVNECDTGWWGGQWSVCCNDKRMWLLPPAPHFLYFLDVIFHRLSFLLISESPTPGRTGSLTFSNCLATQQG